MFLRFHMDFHLMESNQAYLAGEYVYINHVPTVQKSTLKALVYVYMLQDTPLPRNNLQDTKGGVVSLKRLPTFGTISATAPREETMQQLQMWRCNCFSDSNYKTNQISLIFLFFGWDDTW